MRGAVEKCGNGTIYAFIHAPARSGEQGISFLGWIRENNILFGTLLLVAGLAIFLPIYFGFRLFRYRKKYKNTLVLTENKTEEV